MISFQKVESHGRGACTPCGLNLQTSDQDVSPVMAMPLRSRNSTHVHLFIQFQYLELEPVILTMAGKTATFWHLCTCLLSAAACKASGSESPCTEIAKLQNIVSVHDALSSPAHESLSLILLNELQYRIYFSHGILWG